MRSLALAGLVLALMLTGCGGGDSGTGGGSGGRVVDKDDSGNSGEMDAFIEDSLEVEQGQIEKYREDSYSDDYSGTYEPELVYDCRMVISPVDGEVNQECGLFEE